MPEQENVMNEVLTRLTRIETKIDSYRTTLNDHETRIRALESKPGKKWDAIVAGIIGAVIAGLVGFVIGKLLQ